MGAYVWPTDAVSGAPAYSGRKLRQLLGAVWGGRTPSRPLGASSGVVAGTPSTTVTISGTTVSIAPHQGVMNLETANESGAYNYSFDSIQTQTINAAPSSPNSRIDIIWVRIDDPAESDGTATPIVTTGYSPGSPGTSPAVPAVPNGRCMIIAQVNVPFSGAATITWVAPYAVATGGIVPVTTLTAAPATPYEGTGAYMMDENKLRFWDGSKWALADGGEAVSIAAAGDHTSGDTPCLVTISAVAGRIYKASAAFGGSQVTAAGIPTVKLLINAAEVYRLATAVSVAASGLVFGSVGWYFQAPATASVPFAITMQDGPGALRIAAGGCQLGVKEVG